MQVSTRKLALPTLGALVLLCACGGNSGGLRGTIRTTQYTVPVGETRTLSGDLIVRSTGTIVIDGTLRVPAGMNLALLADGALTIRGKIETAPSRAQATRQTPEPAAAVLYAGGGMNLETRGEVTPAATILAVAATNDITIDGTLAPADAPDGTSQTDHGDDGYDVEIGTERAIAHLRDKLGIASGAPRNVTITGTVRGGHGGDGFDDATGRLNGRDLIVQGTDGGDGGDVKIEKTGSLNGTARGGNGGDGGDAGTAETPARAPDGVTSGERGGHVTARSGNGGPLGHGVPSQNSGTAGVPGVINVVAGNGGPGGDGGNASLTPGIGLAHDDILQTTGGAGLFTVSGGNGGPSDAPTRVGGKGGSLSIFRPFFAMETSLKTGSRIDNFGNGAGGFDGCAILPCTDGSAAGNGGNVTSAINFGANIVTNSFNGGRGGNGVVNPGAGGAKGENLGSKGQISPLNGTAGTLCPAITDPRDGYIAVVLDFDLGADLKRGDTVPLYRIRSGHLSGPELPVTDTQGCASTHLHGGGVTIRALKAGRWIDLGPFNDPNGSKCGYGVFTVTANKEIQSATGVR